MIEPFDRARPRLERQYAEAAYDPASGLSGEELAAALARRRAEGDAAFWRGIDQLNSRPKL